jgi:toxin ParE1/3/4
MIIKWTNRADNERFDQLEYIFNENPVAASEIDIEIEIQVEQLSTHPKMGRIGRRKGTYEMVINRTPFIAIYRIKKQRIEIIRFLHGKQQWP